MLRSGEIVLNEYTIKDKIGEGGLGVVYSARSQTGEEVVVKIPSPRQNLILATEKLNVEISVLRDLWQKLGGNNYIVRYVNSGNLGAQPLLVEDYIHGVTLEGKIDRDGRLDQATAVDICVRILEAVKFMHSSNIIHRDLCPDNIMLRAGSLAPVIIDLGTCKMGFVVGNVTAIHGKQHIAPEVQAGGLSYTSDLYSVAASLFSAITGKMDLSGYMTPTSRGARFVNRPSVLAKCEPWLGAILDGCLEFDPARRRFQTADELISALRAKSLPPIVSRCTLVVRGNAYPLDPLREYAVGREGDIPVPDPERYISRVHSKLTYDVSRGSWVITDDSSRNGTIVRRGQATNIVFTGTATEHGPPSGSRRMVLQDGDVIGLAYSPSKGTYYTDVEFVCR